MDFDIETFLVAGTLLAGLLIVIDRIRCPAKPRWLFDIARSFFPILLIVLILRSFIIEPFRIPSGSMLPTLEIGDFIVVNKFAYGIKLPLLHWGLIDIGEPERGDVVVFRYPHNPSQDYIKRLVGLPGDRISYKDKQLFINGKAVARKDMREYPKPLSTAYPLKMNRYTELLGEANHDILLAPDRRGHNGDWVVPEDSYFVMGDNRDNSNDSRAWGFVGKEDMAGKAFLIWMSWNYDENYIEFSRIWKSIY